MQTTRRRSWSLVALRCFLLWVVLLVGCIDSTAATSEKSVRRLDGVDGLNGTAPVGEVEQGAKKPTVEEAESPKDSVKGDEDAKAKAKNTADEEAKKKAAAKVEPDDGIKASKGKPTKDGEPLVEVPDDLKPAVNITNDSSPETAEPKANTTTPPPTDETLPPPPPPTDEPKANEPPATEPPTTPPPVPATPPPVPTTPPPVPTTPPPVPTTLPPVPTTPPPVPTTPPPVPTTPPPVPTTPPPVPTTKPPAPTTKAPKTTEPPVVSPKQNVPTLDEDEEGGFAMLIFGAAVLCGVGCVVLRGRFMGGSAAHHHLRKNSAQGKYQGLSTVPADDDEEWGWGAESSSHSLNKSSSLEMTTPNRSDRTTLHHRSSSPGTADSTKPRGLSVKKMGMKNPLSATAAPAAAPARKVAAPAVRPRQAAKPKKLPPKEDDFFEQMGFNAKPSFKSNTLSAAPSSGNAATEWDDDGDLDDLLDD